MNYESSNWTATFPDLAKSQLLSPAYDDACSAISDTESDLDLLPPNGKRLAPVGANAEDDELRNTEAMRNLLLIANNSSCAEMENMELQKRLDEMEQEQEELNNSLMSMTSHFAKVQLRLQQVVSAPSDRKEELLKELEHFAFRGIPNLSSPRPAAVTVPPPEEEKDVKEIKEDVTPAAAGAKLDKIQKDADAKEKEAILEAQRKKHTELIQQLKGQLEELESYAYESGENIVPSNMLLERQRVVMEQLKARLNLNMDNIVQLSEDELKAEVDSAIGQIVNPLKMKSHLVTQLMTQITDLEAFIEFLQSESSTLEPPDCQCGCSKHANLEDDQTSSTSKKSSGHKPAHPRRLRTRTKSEQEVLRKKTVSILEKTMAVLQLTTVVQFGCGASERFSRNTLKQTPKGNHYGDLRARLELAVDRMLDACGHAEYLNEESSSTLEGDDTPDFLMNSPEVTAIARKELAPALRDLIQHGLIQGNSGRNLMPFMGCMSSRQNRSSIVSTRHGKTIVHAWDVVVRFYDLKQGSSFNSQPQRKLSQSFGLDLAGSSSNNKQSLLSTIGNILTTHGQYKRSPDAHFKAFICAGLNKRKLIPWLKLILRNQNILESHYQPWSYAVKTGFDDCFRTLERLSMFVFDIPEDIAVKQFQDLSEAF